MTRTAEAPSRADHGEPGGFEVAAEDLGDFRDLYRRHADFVWRSLRRLGVHENSLDDLTQEVFLIAFRELPHFEHRSRFTTWLYGIAYNLSRTFIRNAARFPSEPVTDALSEPSAPSPQDALARREAVTTLYAVLDALEPQRRAVFVMAELEQLTAPEIAEITGAPLNTVYTRLRLARREFEGALARFKARETRSQR